MNARIICLCFSFLALMAGCDKGSDGEKNANAPDRKALLPSTNQQEYPALSSLPNETLQQDGYYGLVHIFSRHYLEGANGKGQESKADFVVHGAGGLIAIGQNCYIITAKHVIVPNAQIKTIKLSEKGDPVEFDKISATQSQILIGSLGIQPNTVMLSENEDVAILAIADQDKGAILSTYSKDRDAPISVTNDNRMEDISGMRAEAWGFPAQHSPQVERV